MDAEGENKSIKQETIQANDGQKISLLKRMIELKYYLYGELKAEDMYRKKEAWEEVMTYANDQLSLPCESIEHLKDSVANWRIVTDKKYDPNGQTGNGPSISKYSEVDNCIFELFGRGKGESLINAEMDEPMDDVDPAALVRNCGPKGATSVLPNREMEDDELSDEEDEEGQEGINQQLNAQDSTSLSTAQSPAEPSSASVSSPAPLGPPSSPRSEEVDSTAPGGQRFDADIPSEDEDSLPDYEEIYWRKRTELVEAQIECVHSYCQWLENMTTVAHYQGLRQKLAYERELADPNLRPPINAVIDPDDMEDLQSQVLVFATMGSVCGFDFGEGLGRFGEGPGPIKRRKDDN